MLLSVLLILGQSSYDASPGHSTEYLPSVRTALGLQINARQHGGLKRQLIAKIEAVKRAEAELKGLVAQGVDPRTRDWYLWQLSYMALDLADLMTRSPAPKGLTWDQQNYYRELLKEQFVDPWMSGASKGLANIAQDFRLPASKQRDYDRALRVLGKESGLFGGPPARGARNTSANLPLTIHQVSPVSGSVEGGTQVRLRGTGFTAETVVLVGGNPGLDVACPNEGTLTFRTPPGEPGTVFIAVKKGSNGAGQIHQARIEGAFTYKTVAAAEPMAQGDDSGIHVERVDGSNGRNPRAGGIFASCQAGVVDLWTGLLCGLLYLRRRRAEVRLMG